MNKRRFRRIGFAEKCIVEHDGCSSEVNLLDISLKGALLRFEEPCAGRAGDRLHLSFLLGGVDIPMKFTAEVVHVHDKTIGVKFVETDLETMIHLRSLMEARTMDPDRVRDELVFLIDGD